MGMLMSGIAEMSFRVLELGIFSSFWNGKRVHEELELDSFAELKLRAS